MHSKVVECIMMEGKGNPFTHAAPRTDLSYLDLCEMLDKHEHNVQRAADVRVSPLNRAKASALVFGLNMAAQSHRAGLTRGEC
jgi:hypothetical protein